jgi:hexosaminidase
VVKLLEKCKEMGLDVIPLVQTFGHLEFVLKLEQFSNLRELPEIPQALCPSKNNSFKMVTKLLHQVVELHSSVRIISHLGINQTKHLICSAGSETKVRAHRLRRGVHHGRVLVVSKEGA